MNLAEELRKISSSRAASEEEEIAMLSSEDLAEVSRLENHLIEKCKLSAKSGDRAIGIITDIFTSDIDSKQPLFIIKVVLKKLREQGLKTRIESQEKVCNCGKYMTTVKIIWGEFNESYR